MQHTGEGGVGGLLWGIRLGLEVQLVIAWEGRMGGLLRHVSERGLLAVFREDAFRRTAAKDAVM